LIETKLINHKCLQMRLAASVSTARGLFRARLPRVSAHGNIQWYKLGRFSHVASTKCARLRGSRLSSEHGTYKTVRARRWPCRPDSGLVFQLKVRETFQAVPSSLGSGPRRHSRGTSAAPAPYRGASRLRNRAPLGPYSKTMPRALWTP